MKSKLIKTISLFLLLSILALPACEVAETVTTDKETEPETTAAATSKDTETEAETQTGEITETETEEETTAPEPPPYDDSHAYIFAESDKKSKWVTSGIDVTREFNVLKMIPTNHDPMIYCAFAEEEQFDSAEYHFVAYRYNVKSFINQGVFFVCSENHPQFSDDGLTWLDVKNNGTWVNSITDMSKNAFWEGKITAFRIDPINSGTHDKNAVIYVDRVGFFKTEEDAREFLDAVVEPDYSEAASFLKGYAKALVPGGTLSEGYDSSDYTGKFTEPAEKKGGVMPLVAYRNGDNDVIVPVSYVNSVGFIKYMAEQPGDYTLIYIDKQQDDAVGFVTAREIMTAEDASAAKLTNGKFAEILKNTLVKAESDTEKWAKEFGIDLSDKDKTADAKSVTAMLAAYLNHLGIKPYIDSDLYAGKKTADEKLVYGSGIMAAADETSELSGDTAAHIIYRLIMAMLDEPVCKSNISDKDGITIGAWSQFPYGINEKTLKTFSEAGLSLLINLGDIEERDTLKTALNSARKYGVKVLRYNYSPSKFNASKPDAIPVSCLEYYDYDSYLGNMIYDEPGTNEYERMAALTEYYNNILPNKLCYYNLLPMYANAAQLKYGAGAAKIDYYDSDPDLYKKYVEAYAETVPGYFMCVDIYPYRSSGKTKKLYNEYLKNMDIFATACRKYDREFWLFIQSTDYDGGKWTPDYADLRWQLYIGLSFGVKTYLHYLYSYQNHYSLVVDGEPTEIYYAAQKADNEILALSDDYVQYKNVGCFNLNCDKTKYAYAQFDNQYKDFKVIKEIKSDDPLLVGCFEKKEGNGYAFTVVNMNSITKPAEANLTFTLDGSYKVYVYQSGVKTELKADAGVYSLKLENAEGAFIILE